MIDDVGKFRNKSELMLHTFEAVELCRGKQINSPQSNNKYKVPSLFDFGFMLTRIWAGMKVDDPYAELALIEIERLIERGFSFFYKQDITLENIRNQRNFPKNIKLNLHESEETITIPINQSAFSLTHARLFLVLLANYDSFIRKLKTYNSFGIINYPTLKRKSYKATKIMRAVLMYATSYNKRNVTRHDILDKTSIGREAIEKYGLIPLDILTFNRTSQYGPNRHKGTHN